MLNYSLRANPALRSHGKGNSAFERTDLRPGQSAVPLSIDRQPRFSDEDTTLCDHGAPAVARALDHGVDIFPSNAVHRNAIGWNGGRAEVVQATRNRRIEFSFRAPFHLLIAYEGVRRDGETFVEGLPSSRTRELRRR